ncbi:MAG: IS110 family transposase [Gemmatimonadales bacterium]
MYYAGLDLHKRCLTLCVLDSAGQVVREQRKLAPTLEAVTALLAGLGGPVTVVLEATLQWTWFHDRLTALGHPVLVAHPQQLKLISQARCKTDPIDARKLAELGRVHLVPAIWVPDPATRERRLRLRGRARLVRWRTRLKNRVHALLAGENFRAPGTDLFSGGGRAWLAAVPVPAAVRAEIEVTLELIAALDTQVAVYDQLIRRWARALPAAQLLQSVPGIGPFGALLLLAELGTITRFRSSHELTAYAGLVPSTRSSGGKTAHGSVGPAGSGWLKWILIEAVQTLKQRPGPVQAHYERLLQAKGKPKATVAAARKLCCYLYWMLRNGWSYGEWLQHETVRAGCPVQALASAAR